MFLDCAGHIVAEMMAHNTVCKVTNIPSFCQMFVVFFCLLARKKRGAKCCALCVLGLFLTVCGCVRRKEKRVKRYA